MSVLGSLKGIASGVVSHLPGAGLVGAVASHIPGLQGVGDFLSGNGGMNGLAVAQGLNAAYTGKKAGDYAGDALKSVRQAYDANAPLRDAGRAQMLHPEQGIAARIAAIPQGPNPYSSTPPMPQQPQLGPAMPHGGNPLVNRMRGAV